MTVAARFRTGITIALSLGSGVLATLLFTLWRSVGSYDECVLQGLRGVNNEAVAGAITSACRRKFSQTRSPTRQPRDLTPSQIANLTGRAAPEYGTQYKGSIYNGNEGITVTDVDIALATIVGRDTTTRVYRTALNIPPLSVGDFAFAIVVGEARSTYEWSIAAARGIPVFESASDELDHILRNR